MPADFYVDEKRGIVFSKATGVFSRIEALDHMERLLRHHVFHAELNQLWDFRDVTSLPLSNEEIRELAKRPVFGAVSRRAFVVSSDLQFGLSRMFGIYRELEGEKGIIVFRDMKTALRWLSLSAEPDPKAFPKLISVPNEA